MDQSWVYNDDAVDWGELSELYRKAPLGEIEPSSLASHSVTYPPISAVVSGGECNTCR